LLRVTWISTWTATRIATWTATWIAWGALTLWPSAAPAANRDALREIVQDQCLVHWRQDHTAAPCERLVLPHAPQPDGGYAVLADRKGGAHFLLIPTDTISGPESPRVLAPDAPNYFDAAWAARDRLAVVVGHAVPRTAVGLAVNPRRSRSQDQLHIHISCLRPDVAGELRAAAAHLGTRWAAIDLGGSQYQALRVLGESLAGHEPFALIAQGLLAGAGDSLADNTILVAGMQFAQGPGFAIVAGSGTPAELLLDSSCAAGP
jgi:CDP-diacylglycerol pyrophosphatase